MSIVNDGILLCRVMKNCVFPFSIFCFFCCRSTDGSISDINFLHNSLRKYNASETEEVVELHRTVQNLFDEEETLLNLHMNVIQVVTTTRFKINVIRFLAAFSIPNYLSI